MSTPSPDISTAAPAVDDKLFTLANAERERRIAVSKALARHSLSVVLPTFNEEQAIRATLVEITTALDGWGADYEVIVVNDGSRDRTAAVASAYAAYHPQVRVVTHATNQGYGAALSTGFAAASKDLTFFMDSDGQFTINDLPRLLAHIDAVDAVLGYRVRRQDSAMRHLNARGWSALTRLTLGVRARDLDCAFKLFRTEFVRAHPPTTGGALVNAELLHALRLSGGVYREVGVRHFPATAVARQARMRVSSFARSATSPPSPGASVVALPDLPYT